jgi:hypothetical protein
MSEDDDRRALERYVAGLPVDPDALAHAVAARAVERAIVVEALEKGLAAPDPATRLSIALRLRGMHELDPALAARLAVMTDQDDDERVRSAATETLREHGIAMPAGQTSTPPQVPIPILRFVLGLRLLRVMDDDAPIAFEALFGDDAPDLAGELLADGPDRSRIELRGLPPAFIGTRPVLRAARDGDMLEPVAAADAPVAPDGSVILHAEAPHDDVERWCRVGADLVLLDDGLA